MKNILLLSLLLTVCSSLPAQSSTTPEARAKAMVGQLHLAINLQGQEWTVANNAFTDYYKALEEMNKNAWKDKGGNETKVKVLRTQLYNQLSTSLSPERMRLWTAYKEKEKIQE